MNLDRQLILASESPRRKALLEQANLSFTVQKADVAEDYPPSSEISDVPVYLAEKKARYFQDDLDGKIILAADTVVALNDQLLGKPANAGKAASYLMQLSGRSHEVITGFCIITEQAVETGFDRTRVYFRSLTEAEVKHYVAHYEPYDKAGGYAIQEWIGLIGVKKIEGSYANVMGLPVHKVYKRMRAFAKHN